jgi:Ferredoxin-like domain in Api92-like protein
MPNWCYSQLRISGEPKELNKFLKEVERTPSEANEHYEASKFAFNRIIPMPDELLYQGDSWYNWRNKNWLTKWECSIDYDTTSKWETGEVMIDYRTAWSPPEPIMQKVIKKYPKLFFRWTYYEEGYEFWGDVTGDKGQFIINYDGEFRDCEDYKQFGLTHHECYRCENYYECGEIVEVGDEHQICWSCKEEEIEADKELWNTETEVITNGTKALSN